MRAVGLGARGDMGLFTALFAEQPIGYARVGPEHLYCLSDPEDIKKVFITNGKHMRKGKALRATRPMFGDGLLLSDGEDHLRNRRLVQPAFHHKQIQQYSVMMQAAIDRLDARWQSRVAAGESQVIVADEMSALTLDIVGQTLFGADLTDEAGEVGEALSDALTAFSRIISPVGFLLLRLPSRTKKRLISAVATLDGVMRELISAKRAALAAGTGSHDALAMLIQAQDAETGVTLTDSQVRDELITLFLAGHETTAMLLSWTWLELALNPDIKSWVSQEWDDLAGDAAGISPNQMPRTNALVAESMRLHPPAWIIGRESQVDLEVGGYELPAGSTILASQYFTHRDPRFWQEPTRFNPTRWLDADGHYSEQAPGQPRHSYFPFGFGARKCIGDQFAWTEAVIALAMLGQRWHVTPVAPSEVVPEAIITLRPENGIPARIRRRAQELDSA